MKRWITWGLGALIVVLLAAGVLRAMGARKAQQVALAEQTARSAQTVVELALSDVLLLQPQEL
ncbi:MAG TPA: efflux transporter periplasmic adaptor subunit, partial [Curvibacter sp.]|nr:efflux transporter periplasmic adaptor subunit [Curvibacter sp.]